MSAQAVPSLSVWICILDVEGTWGQHSSTLANAIIHFNLKVSRRLWFRTSQWQLIKSMGPVSLTVISVLTTEPNYCFRIWQDESLIFLRSWNQDIWNRNLKNNPLLLNLGAYSSREAGCTLSDGSLNNISFRRSEHSLLVLWYTVQIPDLVTSCVPARAHMLNFSLNSHLHLHWDQQLGFGECFLGWRVPNSYLTTRTSGSNEILLNVWLKTQSFYFLGIVSSSSITRNLAGTSVIVLSHAGQQHPGFIWTWSTCLRQSDSICDNLLHLQELPGDRQSLHLRMQTAAKLFRVGQIQFKGW